jgi:spermidine synthase
VARIVARDARLAGRVIGAASALNTAGAIAGSLAAVFLLVPALGMQGAILACVLTNLGAGAALLVVDRDAPRRRAALAACAAAALAAVAIPAARGETLPRAILRGLLGPGDEVVELREGVTGTSAVARSAKGGFELWSDAVAISATRNGSFYAPGLVAAALAPKVPETVLSLAFGGGLSSWGVRLFPEVRRLDCVDLSRENMELAVARFPENAGLADDGRARFVVDDARNHLRFAPGTYDLILVEATPPRLGFHNAFLFTREFFESARRKLAPGGLFAQVLPLADISLPEARGALATFAGVFPGRAMWFMGGPDVLMIGTETPLAFRWDETARRLARPAVARELQERLRIAQYQAPGNFFSGLLLDSAAWARAAEGGEIFSEDRLPLMFSTGRDAGTDDVRHVHEHLVPWRDVLARMADRDEVARAYGPERLERLLEDRRRFFAAHMYGGDDFYPAMLSYIERFALDPAGERSRLYDVLRARGRDAEAEDLARRMTADRTR